MTMVASVDLYQLAYKHTLMLIMHEIQMIVTLLVGTVFILVMILYLGAQRNIVLSLALALRQSTTR